MIGLCDLIKDIRQEGKNKLFQDFWRANTHFLFIFQELQSLGLLSFEE